LGSPFWLSDALCRVASGGSFAIRQLYTDCDEILFQAARPAILNGIEDIVCRSDLADRAIFLALGPISDERRRAERQLGQEFEALRPRILGALFDAAAHGLRKRPCVRLERSPRMADFAVWGIACETAFWPSGTFLRVYDANRRTAIEGAIEADPVAAFVGKSWPCAAHGQEGPRIFCVPISPQAKRYGSELQAGQVIHVPSPAGYGAARRF